MDIGSFQDFLKRGTDIDFCFVNDGSRDNTARMLSLFVREAGERLLFVDNPCNCGKAEAVRLGMERVLELNKYELVGFMDADLATPLSEIARLVRIFDADESAQVVIGSRIERMGVVIERKLFRHYSGRLFATAISVLFHLNAYDTQCGAKVFRSHIAGTIFKNAFISRWLFDVELLLRVRNGNPAYNLIVKEIPLNVWVEQGNSKIRFSHLLKMPWELCRIYRKYKVL